MKIYMLALLLLIGLMAVAEPIYRVNLGDYAKGDGTDETEAIQRAIDALLPIQTADSPPQASTFPGGVLYIPRPEKFYGISQTINIVEKWNITIECENYHVLNRQDETAQHDAYFRWLGADGGTMFNINACMGVRINGLSLDGRDEKTRSNRVPGQSGSHNVTGIHIGPQGNIGFSKFFIVDGLRINNVATGIRLGGVADNGGDVAFHIYRMVLIDFSQYGIIGSSGNLANIEFSNVTLNGTPEAENGVLILGGEILFTNLNGYKKYGDANPEHSFIRINAGAVQINKAWSEWAGPFLYAPGRSPEYGEQSSGSVFFPTILTGVRHFDGAWQSRFFNDHEADPVPLAIIYNNATPLQLIGCTLWGSVKLLADGQNALISVGTDFISRNLHGYIGPGVETFHNMIVIGTPASDNHRIIQPYVIDRRNWPGSAAPNDGRWFKGDRVVNTDPDPSVPAKAWAGWICVEEGVPGRWAPFGRIESLQE